MAKKHQDEDEFRLTPEPALAGLTDEEVLAAGHDLAGYRQGESAFVADEAEIAANPDAQRRTNPFEADSVIGLSWQAGYDAATPPPAP